MPETQQPAPDTWGRVQDLFLRVADLPPAEQRYFLDVACKHDPALRGEVESLLAKDGGEVSSISAIITGTAGDLFAEDAVPGSRIGPWRLVRELGRGGMGSVFLASRDDDEFRKQVAIKIVRRGMDTADVLARFRQERQVLASLDHPFIARLIDGGSTSDGRPFLVMEFVEGIPITDYCRMHGLSIRERCRLFLKVCEAVDHAHRNLVVHRDLKPPNLLIAADGTPKLLDFGLAKILHPGADHSITFLSQFRALTPDYASPEQSRGSPAAVPADIYSLGGIFYELLTGVKVHRLDSDDPAEWTRIICEVNPLLPSQAATSAVAGEDGLLAWRKQLAGDLDTIILKALQKEPGRRYASVEQFADDARGYLDDRPIAARKDSALYLAGKFIQRNRTLLTASSFVAMALLGGVIATGYQAHQAELARRAAVANQRTAEKERERAEAQTRDAERARASAESEHLRAQQQRDEAIAERLRAQSETRRADERLKQVIGMSNRSLSNVYSLMERLPGAMPARRELIGTALEFLEQISRESRRDDRLNLALATAYLRLGDLQGNPDEANIGDPAGALKSYRAGAEAIERTAGRAPDEAGALAVWLELQEHSGRVLIDGNDVSGALTMVQRALQVAGASQRLLAGNPRALRNRALLLLNLSRGYYVTDLKLSLQYAQACQQATATLQKQFPKDPQLVYDLSVAHTQIGWVRMALGDLESTASEYKRTVELREQLFRDRPYDILYRRGLMLAYEHYGAVEGCPVIPNLGQPSIAREYYKKSQPMEEEASRDPQNFAARYEYAAFLLRQAAIEVPASQVRESLAALRKAATLFESASTGGSSRRYGRELALAQEYIGRRLIALGEYRNAAASLEKALDTANRILNMQAKDEQFLDLANECEQWLTEALLLAGDRDAALRHARAFVERTDRGTREGWAREGLRVSNPRSYLTLAKVLRASGDFSGALESADRAANLAAPLVTHRAWDPAAAVLNESRTLAEECGAKLAASVSK